MKKNSLFLILAFLSINQLFAVTYKYQCSEGTGIKAIESGIVENVGYNNALGNFVTIKSIDKEITYSHLMNYRVKRNQKIDKGIVIANSGNTGYSINPCIEISIISNNENEIDFNEIKSETNEVFSIQEGAVLDIGFDNNYGNYVKIYSIDNIITYFNLEKILVNKNNSINCNTIIGYSSYDETEQMYVYKIQNEIKIEKDITELY